MLGFVGRRFLLMIPTIVGISMVIFLMVRLMPGDIDPKNVPPIPRVKR